MTSAREDGHGRGDGRARAGGRVHGHDRGRDRVDETYVLSGKVLKD
jgi:hypothetical protein